MQVVLKAPIDRLVKRLSQKGFCDNNGIPTHKAAWQQLDEDQIILLYSSINRGLQEYYRPADNWSSMQYILKFSLAKTLAAKRQVPATRVIKGGEIKVGLKRAKGKTKEVIFYRNTDWKVNRNGFSESQEVDLVRMSVRLRTRSKLGQPCCICGDGNGIAMHHVRHIRKMDSKAQGFTRVMAALNRKQIPVCRQCHAKIHQGKYDGLSLRELAYDPRKPRGSGSRTSLTA
jgi:hypothetical protein